MSNSKTSSKKNSMDFAEKVQKFLKRGKKGQIKEFHNEIVEILNEKIEENEKRIRKLNGPYGKIAKAEESKKSFVFNIDTDKLSDPDTRGDYAMYYVNQLLSFDHNYIDPYKREIERCQAKIEKLKDVLKYIENVEPDVEEDDEE